MLDALTSWQLVRELKEASGKASAASYKHVSPAGAAIAKPIDGAFKESQFLKTTDFSEVASAYVRARGGIAFALSVTLSRSVMWWMSV